MATLPQLRAVSDLPFTLSFPQHHGTARRHRARRDGKTRSDYGRGFGAGSSTADTGELASRGVCHTSLCKQAQLSGMTRADVIPSWHRGERPGQRWVTSRAGLPQPIPCQPPPVYSSRGWEWLVLHAHSLCHPAGHRGRGQFPCPPDA